MTPLCACHGEPKYWETDRSKPNGGLWRCAIKRTESLRKYNVSAKGRARDRRYRNSPMGALTKQLLDLNRIRVRY